MVAAATNAIIPVCLPPPRRTPATPHPAHSNNASPTGAHVTHCTVASTSLTATSNSSTWQSAGLNVPSRISRRVTGQPPAGAYVTSAMMSSLTRLTALRDTLNDAA